MHEPKADNAASRQDPLFKFRRETDDSIILWETAAKIIVYGLSVALIILGAMFNLTALSIIGMTVFILCTMAFVLFSIRNRKSREHETNRYIEEELENFKNDLAHTMYSYDLDYTAQDLNGAAENYKNVLELETAKITDMDGSDIQFIFKTLKKGKGQPEGGAGRTGNFDETEQEAGFLKKQ